MCGVLPTAIAIEAALTLGAKRAELVEYDTSGSVNRDFDSVCRLCRSYYCLMLLL